MWIGGKLNADWRRLKLAYGMNEGGRGQVLGPYLTKFRAFIFCSGASSGGGVMDLERLRGCFEFIEGDLSCVSDTGSSSEPSVYSVCVSPLDRDLILRALLRVGIAFDKEAGTVRDSCLFFWRLYAKLPYYRNRSLRMVRVLAPCQTRTDCD
jgi:hypothetical protein